MFDYENPYYKTDNSLYSVPESQFQDYLQREGTIVKDYWTDEDYRCFFRRNKDTNQTNDNISIYYSVENNIHPGSLINHYGHTYLILNQESLENRVYRRSDGLNADVMLNTYDEETMQDISVPCFAYDLTGVVPESGDVMSVISGNVELMTGDNEMSRKLKINHEFSAMGNWYKIGSINFKTGIARIGASIIQGSSYPVEYGLKINAEETYTQDATAILSAEPTMDSNPVTNATLIWSSANPDIVSISEDGNATFIGVGTCAITCRWEEHNVTDTVYVEVVAKETIVDLTCEISGKDTMNTGSSATYTAIFYQADGVTEDTTITPVWSLDIPSDISNAATITEQTANTITLKAASGSGFVGKSFGLNLTDADGRYHAMKTIKITSWF